MKLDPSIAKLIKHIYIMGGTTTLKGNATPAAEFNIHMDPEGAAVVFQSETPMTMVSWEVTNTTAVPITTWWKEWSSNNTSIGSFMKLITTRWVKHELEVNKVDTFVVCDAVAAVVAFFPDIVTQTAHHHVSVELGGTFSRGATVIDWYNRSQKKKVTIVLGIDTKRYTQMLEDLELQSWLFCSHMPPKRKPEPGQSTLDSFLTGFKDKSKKAKQEAEEKKPVVERKGRGGNRRPAATSRAQTRSPGPSNTAAAPSSRYSLRSSVSPPPSIYAIENDAHYQPNFLFYSNQIESKPRGARISYIHANWWTDLAKLEEHHGYIQWLFPLFKSSGMNCHSHCLTKGEAKLMRENRQIANRFITSYKMMLNFYGMKLECEITGKVVRHPSPRFCAERYQNLQWHSHNYLRISRILQSLSHCGFRRWKEPLVRFFFEEIEKHKELSNCRGALFDHWIPLLDEDSPEYFEETMELPEDRTDSVYFAQIEKEIRDNSQKAETQIITDLSSLKEDKSEREEKKKEGEEKEVAVLTKKRSSKKLTRAASDDRTEEM